MTLRARLVSAALLAGCGGSTPAPPPDDATVEAAAEAGDAVVDSPKDSPRDVVSCAPGSFQTFDKGCTSDTNCAFGLHQTDCCGSLTAVGFNHALKTGFDNAESAWRASCPACACPPAPTTAEDGKSGNDIGVRCTDGKCTTYVK